MKADFLTDLTNSYSKLEFWRGYLEWTFGTKDIEENQSIKSQRRGVDWIVTLSSGRKVLVDDKNRGRNRKTNKVYGDILLEIWKDEANRKPGWAWDPELYTDYVAYAIHPLGKCYLLPIVPLRRVWKTHGDKWLDSFGEKRAHNRNDRTGSEWVTVSCPIPPSTLLAAITASLVSHFPVTEYP